MSSNVSSNAATIVDNTAASIHGTECNLLRRNRATIGMPGVYQIHDTGDIPVNRNAVCHLPGVRMHYLEEIERVNIELCQKVAAQMELGRFPLILGGDHSIAIGTLVGVRQRTKKTGRRLVRRPRRYQHAGNKPFR